LRVSEALEFYGRLKGAPASRSRGVLEEVGLADHHRKRISELSGGMKQRLALAIALLADPPLLILDELTANLDTEARLSFLGLLRNLKHQGKTILFTSHRLDEVEALADRVLVMESGKKKLECKPDELAEAIGLRCILKIMIGDGLIPQAVERLRGRGFKATPNGTGLHVEVCPRQKAAPIYALRDLAIDVRDFEIVSDRSHLTSLGANNDNA
jgi:ABC-type multidrug transport system ATPase subunit